MRFCKLFLPLLLLVTSAQAQQDRQEIIRQVLEVYLENAEEEFDYTEWQTELEYWLDHPMDLNRASAEDLLTLRFLDELEIQAILFHRKNFADFLSVFELQAVEGLELEKSRLLSNFVKVAGEYAVPQLHTRDFYRTGRHELFLRYRRILEKEKAYSPANRKYFGSPDYFYTRYNYRVGSRISYGFTAEKDPGESFFGSAQPYGFDYWSAHFYVQDVGPLKELAVGDYQLQFGQGLVLWSGLAFSKSASAINIARSGRDIHPYRSANENQFLRGAAATIAAGNYNFTVFASQKRMDGNVIGPDTAEDEATAVFSSLSYSGFHRTPNEMAHKDAISETLAGGRMAYNGSSFRGGITGMWSRFSVPFQPSRLYNKFGFSGDEYWNFAADFKYFFRNLYLFGEVAHGSQNATAGVAGVLASLHPRLDVSLLYRHYPKEYFSLYANPFKEGTSPANENGLYLGLSSNISRNWQLNAYIDQFSSPWLRYLVDAPSRGYEYLVDLKYASRKRFEMYWRYREQQKQRNAPEKTPVRPLENHTRRVFRYHIKVNASETIALKSRVELSQYEITDREPENGALLYQELRWHRKGSRFTFTGRYTIFDVDGYNSRIYVYENDVLYAFSIPFFQEEGVRWYVLGKYRLNRYAELWLRLAQTSLTNRQTIGNGDGLINAPHRTEVKAQVRLKF